MSEVKELLIEMMLHAEMFCSRVEGAATAQMPKANHDTLRLKISQCRGALTTLQAHLEEDQLTITSKKVCADFRHVVMLLLWVAFEAGPLVDRKLFGKLVQIESGFTYLLINHRTDEPAQP